MRALESATETARQTMADALGGDDSRSSSDEQETGSNYGPGDNIESEVAAKAAAGAATGTSASTSTSASSPRNAAALPGSPKSKPAASPSRAGRAGALRDAVQVSTTSSGGKLPRSAASTSASSSSADSSLRAAAVDTLATPKPAYRPASIADPSLFTPPELASPVLVGVARTAHHKHQHQHQQQHQQQGQGQVQGHGEAQEQPDSARPSCFPFPMHLLVSGGGGAFLHPTHPFSFPLMYESGQVFHHALSYPSATVSAGIAVNNIMKFRKKVRLLCYLSFTPLLTFYPLTRLTSVSPLLTSSFALLQNWRFDALGGIVYFLVIFSVLPLCGVTEFIFAEPLDFVLQKVSVTTATTAPASPDYASHAAKVFAQRHLGLPLDAPPLTVDPTQAGQQQQQHPQLPVSRLTPSEVVAREMASHVRYRAVHPFFTATFRNNTLHALLYGQDSPFFNSTFAPAWVLDEVPAVTLAPQSSSGQEGTAEGSSQPAPPPPLSSRIWGPPPPLSFLSPPDSSVPAWVAQRPGTIVAALYYFAVFLGRVVLVCGSVLASVFTNINFSLGGIGLIAFGFYSFCPELLKPSRRLFLASMHILGHVLSALVLGVLLEICAELSSRVGIFSQHGLHSLYESYKQQEELLFPDPNGFRATLSRVTLGFYPACIKWLMLLFDVPEYYTFARAQLCRSASLFENLSRLASLAYYVAFFLYYWILCTPAFAFILGCYLFVALNYFHVHWDEGFSSLRIAHFKSFLRFKIDREGNLHMFCIGIDRVARKWRRDPHWRLAPTELREALTAQEAKQAGTFKESRRRGGSPRDPEQDGIRGGIGVGLDTFEDPARASTLENVVGGGAEANGGVHMPYMEARPSRWVPDANQPDAPTIVDYFVVKPSDFDPPGDPLFDQAD